MPTGRVIRMENVRIITTVMACNYNGLGLIFFSKPFLLRVGKIFLFDRRKKYIYKRSGEREIRVVSLSDFIRTAVNLKFYGPLVPNLEKKDNCLYKMTIKRITSILLTIVYDKHYNRFFFHLNNFLYVTLLHPFGG